MQEHLDGNAVEWMEKVSDATSAHHGRATGIDHPALAPTDFPLPQA